MSKRIYKPDDLLEQMAGIADTLDRFAHHKSDDSFLWGTEEHKITSGMCRQARALKAELTRLRAEVERLKAVEALFNAQMRRRSMNPSMNGNHICETELLNVKAELAAAKASQLVRILPPFTPEKMPEVGSAIVIHYNGGFDVGTFVSFSSRLITTKLGYCSLKSPIRHIQSITVIPKEV